MTGPEWGMVEGLASGRAQRCPKAPHVHTRPGQAGTGAHESRPHAEGETERQGEGGTEGEQQSKAQTLGVASPGVATEAPPFTDPAATCSYLS